MNLPAPSQRFICGLVFGLFLSMIAWSYSVYYDVSISLVQGVFSTLLLAVSFGFIGLFGNLDNVMDNIPF